tara:strand:+ start:110 stop:286 length:177 start_codon:yes stop_codon:yes gene_type:complete
MITAEHVATVNATYTIAPDSTQGSDVVVIFVSLLIYGLSIGNPVYSPIDKSINETPVA